MALGQEFSVLGNWFLIHFTENPGMAFGLEIGGEWGKLALTTFRIIAVSGLMYYLFHLVKTKAPMGYILSIASIFAGATGNIIDSVFYGVLFNENFFEGAEFLPADGGYASWFHGRVVDMFYFPIINGTYPDWFPVFGGSSFQFFRPVFNFADSCITVGVAIILLFHREQLS